MCTRTRGRASQRLGAHTNRAIVRVVAKACGLQRHASVGARNPCRKPTSSLAAVFRRQRRAHYAVFRQPPELALPPMPHGRTAKEETMSNLTEAQRPSPLSDQSLGVVQATASVVAAHADEITARFYPRM